MNTQMPQVDFYLIAEDDDLGRYRFACLLLDKAYQKQHHALAYCPTVDKAHFLDELLWTFRDESFIPHSLCGEGLTPPPPIQIGVVNNPLPSSQRDILLNLTEAPLDFDGKFRRIMEIVPNEAQARAKARDNFRYYRSKQYQLQTHDLTNNPKAN